MPKLSELQLFLLQHTRIRGGRKMIVKPFYIVFKRRLTRTMIAENEQEVKEYINKKYPQLKGEFQIYEDKNKKFV